MGGALEQETLGGQRLCLLFFCFGDAQPRAPCLWGRKGQWEGSRGLAEGDRVKGQCAVSSPKRKKLQEVPFFALERRLHEEAAVEGKQDGVGTGERQHLVGNWEGDWG